MLGEKVFALITLQGYTHGARTKAKTKLRNRKPGMRNAKFRVCQAPKKPLPPTRRLSKKTDDHPTHDIDQRKNGETQSAGTHAAELAFE